MLKIGSKIKVADNSGARFVRIIGFIGNSNGKTCGIGDLVLVSIQKAIPRATVEQHQKIRAVVARTRKEHRRNDGTYVRFDDNAVVLLEKETKQPVGTRIFGPVARELKKEGYDKIVSLANEVL